APATGDVERLLAGQRQGEELDASGSFAGGGELRVVEAADDGVDVAQGARRLGGERLAVQRDDAAERLRADAEEVSRDGGLGEGGEGESARRLPQVSPVVDGLRRGQGEGGGEDERATENRESTALH